MIRVSLIGTALVMFPATPALAFHCPADGKAIDAALAKVNLSAALKAEVMQIKTEVLAQHSAKKYTVSQVTLTKSIRLILNNM